MSGHQDRRRPKRCKALPRTASAKPLLDIDTVATLLMYRDIVLDRPGCRECGQKTRVVSRAFSIAGPLSREMRSYGCPVCGHVQAATHTPNSNRKPPVH
ncbi:hypothetical protein [Rhodoplanes roseus]|uniref:Uncharacterized protein n=1 Tax=Rhodoplanes roseus TaxID=29409 RepID=A0A327KEM8_9BRAD|nr:hypothetical protein [Rhodoplanes roseus]RAI36604.1 hypothetical protein CH341_30245 [Rhodoplanes roseus]